MGFQVPALARASASVLALALICVPLTIGAIWAFPLWDDAWLWLLVHEHGTGLIAASEADRPVMGALWALLATSEPALWRASFVAQALLWPLFGLMAARLWTFLFPHLRPYAMVVGCLTVAPILCKMQMVTVNIPLGQLLSVSLGYGALLLLLRFVTAEDGRGRVALGVSLPLLGLGILVTEYALPVVVAMVAFFWVYARQVAEPATTARAWRAMLWILLTAGVAYALYFVMADYSARPRGGNYKPSYILKLGSTHLLHFPFKVVEGMWRSVAGGVLSALGKVSLNSPLGLLAAAYGGLVAGLLYYGSRHAPRDVASPSGHTFRKPAVLPLIVAFVAGLLPTVAMARIPWMAGDGMASRFELPLLPLSAILVMVASLGMVRRRFWAVPVLLFGFVAGYATCTEVWAAIRERHQMAVIGAALRPYVAAEGYTVAAVLLPERSLGPQRPYELTARLAATWPPDVRQRFWAYRFGGLPPIQRPDLEAEAIFGSRGDCKAPPTFRWKVRYLTRDGPLRQLLWVRPHPDGAVSVEPYCIDDQNGHRVVPRQG